MKKGVGLGICSSGLAGRPFSGAGFFVPAFPVAVFFAVFFAIFFAAGCKKSAPPSSNPITPLQALVNTDTTMTYYHRMLLTGNQNGLLADDSVTLLIPTNDAFRTAGYLIDSIGTTDASRLVQYHFLRTIARPTDPSYVGYATALGFTVYGSKDANGTIYFNSMPVTGDAQQVGKALVYRLNTPLTPPADSLKPLLTADSSISYFARAMSRTGLDTLLSSGNYTFLAPTNAAFNAAGYDSLGAVDSADLTVLTWLTKQQILAGSYFTKDLMGLPSVTTLQGSTITISQSNGLLQFAGPGNSVPAKLVRGNQLAGNNIIFHRIDQVLQ